MARQFRKHVKLKFEIIITSSEIVDAIMDECKVPLQLRHAVIQAVGQGNDRTLSLKNLAQLGPEDIEKFKKLTKIHGNTVQ